MLFKNLLTFSAIAAGASAAPAPEAADPPTWFNLVAIAPGSAVHNAAISASAGIFWINHPQMGAECDRETNNATFVLKADELNLFKAFALPQDTQRIYIDRSDVGKGTAGFSTGNGPIPKNAERNGFALNSDNHIQFDGSNFQACPIAGGESYTIWLSGVGDPSESEGCTDLELLAVGTLNPNSCDYSTI
ncbi:hypothetical protein FQN54_009964 [Arachnomyces sp. PD_36]|nr:hypothetical protein FQN54_009964 [Arachnomyces sp. PD_36]